MQTDSMVIKNVVLYNKKKSEKYDVIIEKKKIISIIPSGEFHRTGNEIEASGNIAIPGLIDMHLHGAGGYDSLEGSREAFETISQTLAQLGTTCFLSAMIMEPGRENIHLKTARECTGKDLGGAELLGIYLEGPFISPEKRGGIDRSCIIPPSLRELDKILEDAGEALKIMCLAPEIPGNMTIIEKLRNLNIIAAFGHSDADYEETLKGFDAGIRHVTHFFNAMRSLHHRNPGPIPAIFEKHSVSVEVICDSHHLHPGIVNLIHHLKDLSSIACITDSTSSTGLPEGTYTYNNRKYESKNGLAKYLDGTIIGSAMCLADVLKNFMKFTGLELKEAIDTVTLNPARILGIDDRKGRLEPGKDADIVLIDNNFDVQSTIISGKLCYQRNNLIT